MRRTLAAAGLFAAVVAAAGLTAPSAQAASTVTGGSATWGFKESFRVYMANKAFGGTINVSGGVTRTDAANSASFIWPVGSGTVASNGAATVNLRGSAKFSMPDHFIYEYSIVNPTVVVKANGSGSVTASVRARLGDSGTTLKRVALGKISGGKVSVTGSRATLRTGSVTLTRAGVDSLEPKGVKGAPSGIYSVGDALDAVSAQFTVKAAPAPSKSSGTGQGGGSGTGGSNSKSGGGKATTAPSTSASPSATASASASANAKSSVKPRPSVAASVACSALPVPSVGSVTGDVPVIEADAASVSGNPAVTAGLIVLLLAAIGAAATVFLRRRNGAGPASPLQEN